MNCLAYGIVPGAPYVSLVMSVAEDAVGIGDIDLCRYYGRRLQLIPSEIDSIHSRGFAESIA